MDSPHLRGYRLVFLIAVPLAWAVLLLFHPAPDADNFYGSLQQEATAMLIVHLGTLVFIGLIGAALYMLVRHLRGLASKVSRLAIGVFVLFYGAGEAIAGVATGMLVRYANDLPSDERSAVGDAAQALYNSFSAELLFLIGSAGWVVATIAAAAAYRRVGAQLIVSILLVLSGIVVLHAPPTGPIGLLFFAGAVALLARSQPATPAAEAAGPGDTDPGAVGRPASDRG